MLAKLQPVRTAVAFAKIPAPPPLPAAFVVKTQFCAARFVPYSIDMPPPNPHGAVAALPVNVQPESETAGNTKVHRPPPRFTA